MILVIDGISPPKYFENKDAEEKVFKALHAFKEKYCKEPKEPNNKGKQKLDSLLKELNNHFSESFIPCKKPEYTGSSYEGLKLIGDELEYDVMFIFSGGEHLKALPIKGEEGFAELEISSDSEAGKLKFKKYLEGNKISPSKIKNKFKGVLQEFITKFPNYKDVLKMKEHGPAIQLDWVEKEKLFFSVDLLLSFEVQVDGGEFQLSFRFW